MRDGYFQVKKTGALDPDWCESYAETCIKLKRGSVGKQEFLSQTTKAIKKAFGTIYRAVAFDVDGTLTKYSSAEVDFAMATIIGGLLHRGVPVLLITGRGRTSTREAANKIRSDVQLSGWYMRRLQGITHNGVFLIKTPSEMPESFLSEEIIIAKEIPNIQNLFLALEMTLSKLFPGGVRVTKEPHSIRLAILSRSASREAVEKEVKNIIRKFTKEGIQIFLCRGSYAGLDCLDISGTNKQIALNFYANTIGVSIDRILRIGDQGQEGGNDHDLLDSPHGFSVDKFSISLTKCLPVLDENLKAGLSGAKATQCLLERVMLFSPLSIAPTPASIRLPKLRAFEKLALLRSRNETENVEQRMRVRLRYLLPEGDEVVDLRNLSIDEIFDPRSGAVRFRDWELDGLDKNHPGLELFGLVGLMNQRAHAPQLRWCMYSDTAILMRGPEYFFAMTRKEDEGHVVEYIKVVQEFMIKISAVLDKLQMEEPDLVRYKILLAIYDNIRNFLLQLQYAIFLSEEAVSQHGYSLTKKLFEEALVPHTRMHYRLLLDPDADWYQLLHLYQVFLKRCMKITKRIGRAFQTGLLPISRGKQILRRWRECDHFLQNVTAVQLGLHQLVRSAYRKIDKFYAIGLTYGGTELSAIAQVVSDARGFDSDAGLLEVSIYHDQEKGKMIREGEQDYVRNMLIKKRPLTIMGANSDFTFNGRSVILLDDNCTTCVTLQLARDILVLMGADVLGAITVRFPGVNRHVQMAMPKHGFPDPEILFGFIRGLIAPSPYARLLYPGKGKNPYLDQTKIFDKARWRIERYLKKNGTPATKK